MQTRSYPKTGVSIHIDAEKMSVQSINANYADAIYNAGAIPLVIPVPCFDRRADYTLLAEQVIEPLDGLLLTGGGDIDAVRYGEKNFPFNGSFTEERDLFEIELCRAAVEQKKPILGICRGEQLLNVAMGGTLFQDIAKQNAEKEILLHVQKAPAYTPAHDVELAAGSRLAQILLPADMEGAGRLVRVNSFHHQAVKDVAPGFRVAAAASDGVVEAIEIESGSSSGNAFTLGVQWHPERMYEHCRYAEQLFERFAEACREYRSGGRQPDGGFTLYEPGQAGTPACPALI